MIWDIPDRDRNVWGVQFSCLSQAVWKYQRLFEKSLLEAREQALAARKQLTAEIRGRDRTPVLDFEEALGKFPKSQIFTTS